MMPQKNQPVRLVFFNFSGGGETPDGAWKAQAWGRKAMLNGQRLCWMVWSVVDFVRKILKKPLTGEGGCGIVIKH